MSPNRLCVFCGKRPEKKSREHVLPQWLIELTGNPKRRVNIGTNFKTGEQIYFDWTSFCVPACESCNNEYSDLEEKAKSHVLKLLDRSPLTSIEYFDFMDWMDKVRIGVWIAYHLIQKNPTNIEPAFHINTRISRKDRMIAIYPIENNNIGLNVFGADSLVFHRQPSCFGLRINNIFIMNMSSDFLFSSRCGFPSPRNSFIQLDGESSCMAHARDFLTTRRIKHPLIRKQIFKPSIHLYQPIMTKSDDDKFKSGFLGDFTSFDLFLEEHTIPPYLSGKGKLFFQHLDKVELISDINQPIEFENCTDIHSQPMHKLIKQIYEFQNLIYSKNNFKAKENTLLQNHINTKKSLLKYNKKIISHYKNLK
jgi:hypothetical protein